MPVRRLLVLAFAAVACACEPRAPLEPTYENVAAVFEASCSFRSCHGGTGAGAARLNFAAARTAGISYDRLLVSVPACMYDAWNLVEPYDPEHSWLMMKIAGPHTGTALEFTPDPSWEHGLTPRADGTLPSSVCPLTVRPGPREPCCRLSFGSIMPSGSSRGLDAERVDLIRRWILAGAPGPDGTVGPRDGGPPDAGRDSGPRDAPPIPMDVPLADGEVPDAPLEDGEVPDAPLADGEVPDAPESDAGEPADAPPDDAGEPDAP